MRSVEWVIITVINKGLIGGAYVIGVMLIKHRRHYLYSYLLVYVLIYA